MNQLPTRSKIQSLLQQPFFLFHVLAFIAVWVFVWRHAFIMNITFDESYSFKLIKTNNFRAMPGSPNTHWLNSFFMKLLNIVFGNEPGYLRLHAIFSFPFYAAGIYKLSNFIKKPGVKITFYCLALFNPFVLDFFSLARGYALALTLQVWAIYYILLAIDKPFTLKSWIVIVLLSALSLGGNLSYLYTVFGFACCFVLYAAYTGKLFSWLMNKQQRIITGLFVLVIAMAIADLLFIKFHSTDMDITNTGFVTSVFESFWLGSLYFAGYSKLAMPLAYGTFWLAVVAAIYFTLKAITSKKLHKGFIVSLIVVIMLGLNALFHVFFNIPFFIHRWSIQWYIPVLLIIHFAIDEWVPAGKPTFVIQYGLGIAAGIAIIFHWAITANTQWCYAWYYQANNRQIINDLNAQHPRQPVISSTIHVLYENYYATINPQLPKAVTINEAPFVFGNNDKAKEALFTGDYLVTYSPQTLQFLNDNHIGYTILKTYPLTSNKLVKLNH